MIPVGIDEERARRGPGSTRQPRSDAPSSNSDVERHGQAGGHDRSRPICAVFADATDGYSAVGRLRASGFRIDLAGSIDGDLIVTIEAGRARLDELAALIAAHQGRIAPERQSAH